MRQRDCLFKLSNLSTVRPGRTEDLRVLGRGKVLPSHPDRVGPSRRTLPHPVRAELS